MESGQRTDRIQEQAIDTEATFRRNYILRIINIVITLAMTSLALGGHYDHADDSDCHGGNFVALNRQGPQMRYCLYGPPSATRCHWQTFICALCGQRRDTVGEARYRLYKMKFGKILKGICTTSN